MDSSDPALDDVEAWFRAQPNLAERLGWCFRQAIDEMIDTRRTGRYSIAQLNAQEKAFIGVKVETVVRGAFELPYRPHGKDFLIAGHEVDCKWSIFYGGWAIPKEQVGHLCLLLHADDERSEMAVGLTRTAEAVLNPGANRDGKRTITAAARDGAVRWLIAKGPGLPENFLLHLDPDDRVAILSHRGGVERAYELYKRCVGRVISRHVMEAIGQQRDDSRRFRGGRGGVRDLLAAEGYVVLNGQWKADRNRSLELGGPPIRTGESVCLRVSDAEPTSPPEPRA